MRRSSLTLNIYSHLPNYPDTNIPPVLFNPSTVSQPIFRFIVVFNLNLSDGYGCYAGQR